MSTDPDDMRCTVCGKRDRSVSRRLVPCHDGCEQGITMTVCDRCAGEMAEESEGGT